MRAYRNPSTNQILVRTAYLCLCFPSSPVALILKNKIMYAFIIATCVLHVRSSYYLQFLHPKEDTHNNFSPFSRYSPLGDQTKYSYDNCHVTNSSLSSHCTSLNPLHRYTIHHYTLYTVTLYTTKTSPPLHWTPLKPHHRYTVHH